jgi:hypothetical protein
MPRLPLVGQDNDTWGTVLNEYLSVSLDTDGTIKSTALTSKIGNAVGSPTTITGIWVGDQDAYNLLTPDASTLYFIQ